MGRTSHGECFLCNNTYTRAGMPNHLRACLRRHMAADGSAPTEFMHLTVRGFDNELYWLHVLIRADATLKTLDSFLRGIWLDCCGHYSKFFVGDSDYVSHAQPPAPLTVRGRSMNAPLNTLVQRGDIFSHTYDLGNPTQLYVRVIDTVQAGPAIAKETFVLARNIPLEHRCRCGEPAIACTPPATTHPNGVLFMCEACTDEYVTAGFPILPITNSPRVGTCAYTGTAGNEPGYADTLTGYVAVREIAATEMVSVHNGNATVLETWPTLHPAALRRAFGAAAMFYAETPWDVLWTDEMLTITVGNRTVYAVVMGEHNDIFGISIYATEKDAKTALAPVLNGRIIPPDDALALFFAPMAAIPSAAAELVSKTGLPLVSPDAYPLTLRAHGTRVLPLNYDEVEVIVAVLQAVALFVRKYRDRLARGIETSDRVPVRTPYIIGAAVQYNPDYILKY